MAKLMIGDRVRLTPHDPLNLSDSDHAMYHGYPYVDTIVLSYTKTHTVLIVERDQFGYREIHAEGFVEKSNVVIIGKRGREEVEGLLTHFDDRIRKLGLTLYMS